jgi:hypothetical protein
MRAGPRFYWAVSVLVELTPNMGGLLVWDCRSPTRGVIEVLPIVVFGDRWFYLAVKYAIERRSLRATLRVPVTLFAVGVALNVVGLGLMGCRY